MLQRINTLLALPEHPQKGFVAAFALLTLVAILGGVAADAWWIMLAPAGLLVLYLCTVDFRPVFWMLMASLPLSMEMELPGGLGTDLPSEPLMWLLTAVSGAWFFRNWRHIDARFLKHPISLLVVAHLSWMTICAANSQDLIVSLKFLLAKGWYVVVFYFLAAHLLNTEKDFKKLVWFIFGTATFTVIFVLARHAGKGFSFADVNYSMYPFYRNKVVYACFLAAFLPLVWYNTYRYKRFTILWWVLVSGILLYLVGINFAFTRAAYLALVFAVGLYFVVRLRLMRFFLIISAAVIILFIGFVKYQDNWLLFAPEFERTIEHKRFENLLEATTRLEDISTMERVYRWVAGTNMIKERPVTGFGPGTFYFFYKNYTVTSFKTYVSDNPERSGMHNYYLMTTVEQGLPGLVIFLLLLGTVAMFGQRLYHALPDKPRRRQAVASLMCFLIICFLMLMNDFVETDKIGSLFFMSLAMLVNLDVGRQRAVESGQ